MPFVALLLCSMGILGVYLVHLARDSQVEGLRSRLETEARLVAAASVSGFLDADPAGALEELAGGLAEGTGSRLTIIAADGTVLSDSEAAPRSMGNHLARLEVARALDSGLGESTRYSTTLDQKFMYVAVPVLSEGEVLGIARAALSFSAVEASVERMTRAIIIALLIATAAVVLAAALIGRVISSPLRRMTIAAQGMAAGALDQKVEVGSSDELGRLAHAFNEMSLSLKERLDTITEERGKLAAMLAAMTDGVMMTDAGGTVTLANRAAEKLFRLGKEPVLGRSLIEVTRDHQIDGVLKRCLMEGKEQTLAVETGAPQRFLRVVAVPLAGGSLAGALLLVQDLTELKSLQTVRQEFVGNVTHELKTPLASIKAMAETLRDVDDPKTAEGFLVRIDAEVDRMTRMITELTELSRIETGQADLKVAAVSPGELVEEVIARFRHFADTAKVDLGSRVAPGLAPVYVDRGRVEQALGNLVHNAIKFTPEGGRVTVSVGMEEGKVAVAVTDTGIGIPADDLPRVFERFYKVDRARSGGGTGLGLAIARHVALAHGGDIRVQSTEGRGSTFILTLPAAGDSR